MKTPSPSFLASNTQGSSIRKVIMWTIGFSIIAFTIAGYKLKLLEDAFIRGSDSVPKDQRFIKTNLKIPLTQYRLNMGDYPSTTEGLQALLKAPVGKEAQWHGPYIESPKHLPPLDSWKQPYNYRYPGTHNKDGYDLFSSGPDKTPGTADDIGNW